MSPVRPKSQYWLPILFLVVLALTRIPGLLPPNFSGVYALAFCAAIYLPGRLGWVIPLAFLLVTDLILNVFVYGTGPFSPFQLIALAGLAGIILLGRAFRASDSWLKLLGGGVLGAMLFYLVTNTAAWLFNPFGNPEYSKDFAGWIIALTKGTGGYPQTWEFFRNTLMSGGLFTGLFVGAMKLAEAPETEPEAQPDEAAEPDPEESKA
jgi:hypothetical protein